MKSYLDSSDFVAGALAESTPRPKPSASAEGDGKASVIWHAALRIILTDTLRRSCWGDHGRSRTETQVRINSYWPRTPPDHLIGCSTPLPRLSDSTIRHAWLSGIAEGKAAQSGRSRTPGAQSEYQPVPGASRSSHMRHAQGLSRNAAQSAPYRCRRRQGLQVPRSRAGQARTQAATRYRLRVLPSRGCSS